MRLLRLKRVRPAQRRVPELEFGRGKLSSTLFVRHQDGDVTTHNLRGPRGRAGKRGPCPQHEWDESGTRVRFSTGPDSWGDWSADLRQSK